MRTIVLTSHELQKLIKTDSVNVYNKLTGTQVAEIKVEHYLKKKPLTNSPLKNS